MVLGDGTAVHSGSGSETFTIVHPGSAGDLISATATVDLGGGDVGSTSEFSRARVALAANQVAVNDTGDLGDLTTGDGICDSGGLNSEGEVACTIRAAIEEVNGAGGIDEVRFDLPTTDPNHAAGVWAISPSSALPAIAEPAIIDATTQPGWTTTPLVELDGTSAGVAVDGLAIAGPTVAVRGLAVNGFDGAGIAVRAAATGGVVIAGNHIGLDAAGLIDRGNGGHGIDLQAGSGPTTVGGLTPSDGNLISGNAGSGIIINGSDGNSVLGNRIGTDVTGTASGAGIGNGGDGVILANASASNTIGQPGAGNIIAGNGGPASSIGPAARGPHPGQHDRPRSRRRHRHRQRWRRDPPHQRGQRHHHRWERGR